MLEQVVVAVGLAALLAFAVLRPWLGLLLLLALVPFNGLLLDVVGPSLHFSSNGQTMLGAWHDSLAGGIIVAAGYRWIRQRSYRLNSVEIAAVVVLACGVISLAISPNHKTALYAFRTLYEPICLGLAIAVLARTSDLPARFTSRCGLAILVSATLASVFAVWQVYGGSFHYLVTYYKSPDGRLPSAYLAAFIVQPRAIGPFHSPNEFGAAMAIALVVAATSGLILVRPALRAWTAAVIGLAVLLSFSRSSWVSIAVAVAALVVLLPVTRARLGALWIAVRSRSWWRTFAPPLAAFVVLVSVIAFSSGLPRFISGTVSGNDPSSAAHAAQLSSLLNGTGIEDSNSGGSAIQGSRISPFGLGLGMAGAKSARFGEVDASSLLKSETWYIDYLLQAGYLGLLALLALAVLIARALWLRRRLPIARAALAAATGLAVGAIFIPVIDEPAVAIPLWSLIGLGLGVVAAKSPDGVVATAEPA
jgi:hypothetical protein